MQSIGDQVKQIRTALGMTQQQLAERSGLAQNVIAEIETGKRESMTLPTVRKVATGLNCQFVGLIPENDIARLRAEQGERVAQKIIAITSGSAAIEMQLPSKAAIEKQIEDLKRDLLTKHESILWQKI